MIIKRNRVGQSSQHAAASESLESALGTSMEWTEEAFEAGLISDRRVEDRLENRADDRRRGYRRVEDRNLISRAYEEATAIRENAHHEGFQEGLVQAQAMLDELRHTMEKLLSVREEALLSVTDEIANLAVEVASRIIKTEVTCDESLVMSLVRDTIQKAGRDTKTILVKVNPDDAPTVKRFLKDEPIPNLQAELMIMDDPMVDAGSCIVETNSGLIDASFTTQLSILRQLFGGGRE